MAVSVCCDLRLTHPTANRTCRWPLIFSEHSQFGMEQSRVVVYFTGNLCDRASPDC